MNTDITLIVTALVNAVAALQSRQFVPFDAHLRRFCAEHQLAQSVCTDAQYATLCRMLLRSLCECAELPTGRAMLQLLEKQTIILRRSASHGAPAHRGITYDVALLVVCDSVNKKLTNQLAAYANYVKQACDTLHRARARRQQDAAAPAPAPEERPLHGRIVLLCTDKPSAKHVAATNNQRLDERVTLELWYVNELQFNPTQHEMVSEHVALDALDASALAQDQYAVHVATAQREPAALPKMPANNIMARWHGFVPGQVVRIEKRDINAGGTSYEYWQVK